MSWNAIVDALGVAAGVATITSQCMRTMIPLRIAAIAANVLFITYSAFALLWPTLILHVILLPLNIRRLISMRELIVRVRHVAAGEFDAQWLRPYTRRVGFARGTVLFRRGDSSDSAYYLLSGDIVYRETGRRVGRGHFVGDLGIFTADRKRTNTGECASDVEALLISYDELTQLYFQNPRFGFYLVQSIVTNLRGHIQALSAGGPAQLPSQDTPEKETGKK